MYEKLHNDPLSERSAHAHWLRVREGTYASNINFGGINSPTIFYSKSAGPQILTNAGIINIILLYIFCRKMPNLSIDCVRLGDSIQITTR